MNSFKINGSTCIPTDNVLRLVPLNDEDRAKIKDKLDIDAAKFHTRIEFANGTSSLAIETIMDIQSQGLALVDLGSERFVPAENIILAKSFSKEDAKSLEGKGYKLSQVFLSTVNTKAGQVLSIIEPEKVMERRSKALSGMNPVSAVA